MLKFQKGIVNMQAGFIPISIFLIFGAAVLAFGMIYFFSQKNDQTINSQNPVTISSAPFQASQAILTNKSDSTKEENQSTNTNQTNLAPASGAVYVMKVLVIKYFPTTLFGNNIDTGITGDVEGSYDSVRAHTVEVTNNLKNSLEKASMYLGYKTSSSPSLGYQIIDVKEYKKAVPFDSSNRRPLYNQILTDNNICDYVKNQGVSEVWMWAYQGPAHPDGKGAYLSISESKMSGPYGDISNSGREDDMPKCGKTYRLYVFNYGRGTAEAMESWGHQTEVELDAVDKVFFRNEFQGPNYPQSLGVNGRCGSVHNPPNARNEYDRANPTPQKSDCLDWNPDSLGTLSDISCNNWTCQQDSDASNPALNYMIWMWQNLPGKGNTKTYQGRNLRNLWDIHGDFDGVKGSNRTIFAN